MTPALTSAGITHQAAAKEFEAALLVFEAACIRGDTAILNRATIAAHNALQAKLDAWFCLYSVATRETEA